MKDELELLARQQMYIELANNAAANFQREIESIPARIDGAIRNAADREEVSRGIQRAKEDKRTLQDLCTHRHPERDGHQTHLVIIRSTNTLYCQKCEVFLTPADPRYASFYADALLAETESKAEAKARPSVSPEEDALYGLPWNELRGHID